ncbi:MAG: hypothetical protein OXI27_01930 [Thaumarchaeota archaeon]|nr:hypothetical protein [Nitrososphaerota archaeon]
MESGKHSISEILRILATKGTYETLLFIQRSEDVGYNAILEYVTSNKIVASRASMHKTISGLTDIGLLERRITQDRPIRTGYRVSERGQRVIRHLSKIRQDTE